MNIVKVKRKKKNIVKERIEELNRNRKIEE